jgi:hypothetical protein
LAQVETHLRLETAHQPEMILYLAPLHPQAAVVVAPQASQPIQQKATAVMEALAAALVVYSRPIQTEQAARATRRAFLRRREVTAATAIGKPLTKPKAAAVVHQRLVQQDQPQAAAMVALVQPRPLAARRLLILAAVVAVETAAPQAVQRAAQAALAAVAAVVEQIRQPTAALLAQPILAAAAVVAALRELLRLLALAQPAAPASSSSNTTSALPQSLPSSHRRSGLHQRVR